MASLLAEIQTADRETAMLSIISSRTRTSLLI